MGGGKEEDAVHGNSDRDFPEIRFWSELGRLSSLQAQLSLSASGLVVPFRPMASIPAITRRLRVRRPPCSRQRSCVFATVAPAAKKPGKDRLAEALNLLNQAKESTSPAPLLYQAKDEVEGTLIPHKDAERDKAVKDIADAISAATLHTNEKKAIERAIMRASVLLRVWAMAKRKSDSQRPLLWTPRKTGSQGAFLMRS